MPYRHYGAHRTLHEAPSLRLAHVWVRAELCLLTRVRVLMIMTAILVLMLTKTSINLLVSLLHMHTATSASYFLPAYCRCVSAIMFSSYRSPATCTQANSLQDPLPVASRSGLSCSQCAAWQVTPSCSAVQVHWNTICHWHT